MRRWALIVVAVWEVATALAGSAFFPRPSVVTARMHRQWLSGDAVTLGRVFGGLGLAAVAGILLGTVIGLSAPGSRLPRRRAAVPADDPAALRGHSVRRRVRIRAAHAAGVHRLQRPPLAAFAVCTKRHPAGPVGRGEWTS
ncbi:hypothetical protein AB0K48_09825 [Nonomuraea sp. NPDC055795]